MSRVSYSGGWGIYPRDEFDMGDIPHQLDFLGEFLRHLEAELIILRCLKIGGYFHF
jgi:hypothetical protein